MNPLATELHKLSTYKELTENAGRIYKETGAHFKEQQTKCLDLMEADECESFRTGGTLYTRIDDRVKGQVEDRRLYLRHCLENDEAVQDFVNWAWEAGNELEGVAEKLYDLLLGGLELCVLKEKQDRCNAQARAHIDDEAPLPPGLTFRPDPYIQQRNS